MTGLPIEVIKYIDYLEGRGISKLQLQVGRVCDIIGDELEDMNNGITPKFLSGDDKTFANFLAIVKNMKDFVALSSKEIQEEDKPKKKITKMQDLVIKGKNDS